MSERAYNMKSALPNKVLDEDGNTTDLFGNAVTPTSEAYKNKPSLPNKWLNPDGTYSTLTEIIAGAIDTDVFVIVDELPEEGNPKKIYLVPDGEGGFNEYHYIDGEWDPIGAIDMGVSPQVFCWNGATDTTGVQFWNDIVQISKTTPVIVFEHVSDSDKTFSNFVAFNESTFATNPTTYTFSFTPHNLSLSGTMGDAWTKYQKYRTVVQLRF